MEVTEILLTLVGITILQAYQIWNLEKRNQDLAELVVGLHLGLIEIEEADEDEY
jgi:hypothetical protein